MSTSGYYDVTTTGSGSTAFVYDGTVGSWISSSSGSFQSNLYLTSSHTDYICVFGTTSGQSYSVTVAPHS